MMSIRGLLDLVLFKKRRPDFIRAIETLTVAEADAIVVTIKGRVSVETAEGVRQQIEEALGDKFEGIRVLVCMDDVKITVLKRFTIGSEEHD